MRCSSLRATGRTRTADPRITNALLYQLSHSGDAFGKLCYQMALNAIKRIIAMTKGLPKADAKVRQKIDICKYFYKKIPYFGIFGIIFVH